MYFNQVIVSSNEQIEYFPPKMIRKGGASLIMPAFLYHQEKLTYQ